MEKANKWYVLLGVLLLITSVVRAQTEEWQVQIIPEEKPIWEVYLQKIFSFLPGTVITWKSDLTPGGEVVGNAWYKPCSAKYGSYYLLATWAQINLYSPYGKLLSSKSTKLAFRDPTTWNSYCSTISSSTVSGFMYRVAIPSNAVEGKYKVCIKFFYRSEDVAGRPGVPDVSLLYGLGEDCDYFYVEAEEPTPTPTPPSPTPGPVCSEGFVGDRWCEGTKIMQTYRYADCRTEDKVIDDCSSRGMICKAGRCEELDCHTDYVKRYCKGQAVYGIKYVPQNGECVETEELIESCLPPAYCEDGVCKSDPIGDCGSLPTEETEWKPTGQCDEEGEIFVKEITYYKYDETTKRCEPVTRIETKIEETENCKDGVPVFIFVLFGGILLVIVVTIMKLYKRR